MTVYYNQVSLQPATGNGRTQSNGTSRVAQPPLRSPEQAAQYLRRRDRQRRQRVRAY